MSKLPALQFYVGDWRKDPGVQSLDYESRGVWLEILCLMHESEDRGKLVLNDRPMPLEALAQILGIDQAKLKQIVSKLEAYGVASRDESGALVNRRMCRDEKVLQARREAGRKGGRAYSPSKAQANAKQTRPPSISSSISSSISDPPKAPLPLADWLGEYGGCLNGVDTYTQRALWGLYGPNGTEAHLWGDVSEEHRPALLSSAILAHDAARTGGTFHRGLFRKVLEGVVRDAARPHPTSEAAQFDAEAERWAEVKRQHRAFEQREIQRLNVPEGQE